MPSPDLRIREAVLEKLDLTKDVSDQELLEQIQQEICLLGQQQYLSMEERLFLQRRVFHSLRKLDVLEDLLEDEEITEIMINGPDKIFVEKKGVIEKIALEFSSKEKLADVIQKMVSATNKTANASHPIVDTRLEDGSRVHIVMSPIAIDSHIITIRKFPKEQITMEQLVQWGSLSQEVMEFIQKLVQAKYNIFVSGATSSGKTTFLNAMAAFIPKKERLITIEDSAELQLLKADNVVRLEAREATLEGKLEVTIRDLVKASLRMRPDRIIVGECRGKEALEVLQSFGTGHDGSFSTGHANSAKDMVARLETMALMAGEMPLLAIRSQIVSGVDIIIHLGRLADGSRKLLEVAEVVGMKEGEVQLQTLYQWEEEEKDWKRIHPLQHQEKLRRV